MTVAYLSLGSNLGDKLAELRQAVSLLDADPQCKVLRISPVYQTEPVGGVKQDDFYNIALALETSLSGELLLKLVHAIEQQLHRVRKIHWGPRTLDIDIVLFGQQRIQSDDLIVPHPEMQNRKFVLKPLMDVYDGDCTAFEHAYQRIDGQYIEAIGELLTK